MISACLSSHPFFPLSAGLCGLALLEAHSLWSDFNVPEFCLPVRAGYLFFDNGGLSPREQRAKLIGEARSVLDVSEKANRESSAEERQKFDTIMADADKLEERFLRAEKLEAAEKSLAASQGRKPTEESHSGDRRASRSLRCSSRSSTNRSRLVLIELLVVITSLMLMTAATIPILAPSTDSRRQRETRRIVTSAIEKAKVQALRTKRPAGILLA